MNKSRVAALISPEAVFVVQMEELGSQEDIRNRADNMIQRALIMFPGVLIPLLDKCNIQPDSEVASHKFFGPSAQTE